MASGKMALGKMELGKLSRNLKDDPLIVHTYVICSNSNHSSCLLDICCSSLR